MYKSHFKLTRNPFDLTPDPVCFVPTKRHNEALAALYYGVRQHKGFVVVTGEVGTGKTLLLRCLLGLLKESKDVAYAYLFNARLSPTEFLQYILSDFGLPASGKSKYELLIDLGQFLISRNSRKMTTVLIVDEAHHLSADILEEVRLLSNLETNDDKLLQIVLAGQPELDEKLDSIGLRQLKQRIAVRTQLGPLDAEETKRYIEQRLQVAGADSNHSPLFPESTIAEVYRHSGGLPRLVNTICENALIAAYARRLPSVPPDIIGYVAKELRLDVVYSPYAERTEKHIEVNVLHAINTLLDLFELVGARRGSFMSDLSAGAAVAPEEIEKSEHERYI
jgi:general secretion pathway protein A